MFATLRAKFVVSYRELVGSVYLTDITVVPLGRISFCGADFLESGKVDPKAVREKIGTSAVPGLPAAILEKQVNQMACYKLKFCTMWASGVSVNVILED